MHLKKTRISASFSPFPTSPCTNVVILHAEFSSKKHKIWKNKIYKLNPIVFWTVFKFFFLIFFIFLWKMDQTRHKEKTKSKNYGNFSLQNFCVLWFSCVISHWKVSFHSYVLIKYLLMHEFLRIFLKETIIVWWEAIFQE